MLTASLPLTPTDLLDGGRPRDSFAWPALTITSNGIQVEVTTSGTDEERLAQATAFAHAALDLANRTRVQAQVRARAA